MNIRKVLIVGSGTLGGQIGWQCATHGFETVMYDLCEKSLEACRATHRALGEMFVSQRGKDQAYVGAVGQETLYHIAAYWGEQNGDAQYKKNAEYFKTHFVDKNRLGIKTGEGYYKYPNPAYQKPEFLK